MSTWCLGKHPGPQLLEGRCVVVQNRNSLWCRSQKKKAQSGTPHDQQVCVGKGPGHTAEVQQQDRAVKKRKRQTQAHFVKAGNGARNQQDEDKVIYVDRDFSCLCPATPVGHSCDSQCPKKWLQLRVKTEKGSPELSIIL